MTELNLPQYDCKIKIENGKRYIFDQLRRRFVAITPEEWVRQHFVDFLITAKGYPAGRIGNEISLILNGTKRRCDTVVYDNYGTPCAIIEYKSPNIDITQNVFDQIARYNSVLKVKYLIVSNGISHYCCEIDYEKGNYSFLNDIPDYNALL